jgi:dCTP diphosphatase
MPHLDDVGQPAHEQLSPFALGAFTTQQPLVQLPAALGATMLGATQAPRFSDLSLEQVRRAQQSFAEARDWSRFHTPRNLLMALMGEVGELAEVFQWKGEVGEGLPEFSPEERAHAAEELSDVLLYLVRLADVCGVDLAAAVQHKIQANGLKYPADACRGSSAKYTAYVTQHPPQQLPRGMASGSGAAAGAGAAAAAAGLPAQQAGVPGAALGAGSPPQESVKRKRFTEQQLELLTQLAEKAGWTVTNLTAGGRAHAGAGAAAARLPAGGLPRAAVAGAAPRCTQREFSGSAAEAQRKRSGSAAPLATAAPLPLPRGRMRPPPPKHSPARAVAAGVVGAWLPAGRQGHGHADEAHHCLPQATRTCCTTSTASRGTGCRTSSTTGGPPPVARDARRLLASRPAAAPPE